jgi:hypothetical protein
VPTAAVPGAPESAVDPALSPLSRFGGNFKFGKTRMAEVPHITDTEKCSIFESLLTTYQSNKSLSEEVLRTKSLRQKRKFQTKWEYTTAIFGFLSHFHLIPNQQITYRQYQALKIELEKIIIKHNDLFPLESSQYVRHINAVFAMRVLIAHKVIPLPYFPTELSQFYPYLSDEDVVGIWQTASKFKVEAKYKFSCCKFIPDAIRVWNDRYKLTSCWA